MLADYRFKGLIILFKGILLCQALGEEVFPSRQNFSDGAGVFPDTGLMAPSMMPEDPTRIKLEYLPIISATKVTES